MAQPGTFTEADFTMVPGQMGPKSARALLAVQETISSWATPYAYLEIGSYAGRSLSMHVRDPDCTYALSVDLRPEVTGDERGDVTGYNLITDQMMRDNLRVVCSDQDMAKLESITGTSADVAQRKSRRKFDLAFIDAEHTVRAVVADFLNILPAMKADAMIGFDDTLIVYPALEAASACLAHRGLRHRVVYTRANIGLILLGRYVDRELLMRPRLLSSADEARDRFHRFYAETVLRPAGTKRSA
ncbi:MAG: class I SAM-dependent methyltransferase [Rhodobacteraceae bacterium]|jgi:hypothetical protein|nr:class I SAM-dependent methyltransferase [Paracoccaceae bacterium]